MGNIVHHSKSLRLFLTQHNKNAKLESCPSFVTESSEFDSMFHFVHNDEKWIYMTKGTDLYYSLPGQELPETLNRRNGFITKMMFLAAVAWQRSDFHHREQLMGRSGFGHFYILKDVERSARVEKNIWWKPTANSSHKIRCCGSDQWWYYFFHQEQMKCSLIEFANHH